MQTSNVDKLVSAQLINLSDLTQKEIDLINSLSQEEVDAIVSVGIKFHKHAASGEKTVRVVF